MTKSKYLEVEKLNKDLDLNYSRKEYMKFLIPSLAGILFFILPVKSDGNWTIVYGIVSGYIGDIIKPVFDYPLMTIVIVSAIMSALGTFMKAEFIVKNKYLKSFFVASNVFVLLRILAAIFSISILFEIGPEMIWGGATGGTVWGIVITLAVWFILASFLMPFLTDFGAMEFAGTLFQKITRPMFTLPGRATVDLLASWLGSGTVGAQLTVNQYKSGYYTGREAATIATCFSAVSISYSLVIANMIDLGHIFFPFYLSLSFAGIIASMVCARIYPLKKLPDTFIDEEKTYSEEIPKGIGTLKWANYKAVEKAKQVTSLRELIVNGIVGFASIMLTMVPVVIAVGTLALIIAEYTPIFEFISLPMGYYLDILGVPDAFAASPATLTGFADMFLPAVLLQDITAEKTRFIIGGLSLMQVIFMSENGALILQSDIPINFKGLLLVFLQRTIIALPVMTLLANLIL